jgi:hypothetical protein
VLAQGLFLALCFFGDYFSEMNDALEFIRDFKMADYGISGWDLLIAVAAAIVVWIVLPGMIALTNIASRSSVRMIVNIVFRFLFAGLFLVMIIHEFLNQEYIKIMITVLLLILSQHEILFARYDKFIDRVADKTTGGQKINKL